MTAVPVPNFTPGNMPRQNPVESSVSDLRPGLTRYGGLCPALT